MTRNLCPRSSTRKPPVSSQILEEEDCKENVPVMYRHVKRTAVTKTGKGKMSTLMKENVSPNRKTSPRLSSVKCCNELVSPVRKSIRRSKYNKESKKPINVKTNRNVLCDKTNTPPLLDNKSNSVEQTSEVQVLKTTENKNRIVHKLLSVPNLNMGALNKNQVPVYKSCGNNLERGLDIGTPSGEKKEAIYEFEVDENEEPVQKKKRKKRAYTRKPKIGPKALTINNIKYSSTESLVSLPEKPIAKKKGTTKGSKTNVKSLSCVTSLTGSEDTCSSVSSFMSHPPSLKLCKNRNLKENKELSILLESQSEHLPSHAAADDHEDSLLPSTSNLSFSAVPQVNSPSVHSSQSISCSPKPVRNYSASKTSFLQPASPCPTNASSISSHEFLSSTPCKRVSAVVCNNSIFEESLNTSITVRQSTGYVKNTSIPTKLTVDNYFGFDEPEEIEEPLVSPIKNDTDLNARFAGKKPLPQPLQLNELDAFKPSPTEVIEMLKASIPTDVPKQAESDVFDIDTDKNVSSVTQNYDEEVDCTHSRKPPRRSYERQRRVRHYSETEEESANEECNKVNEKQKVEDNGPKVGKKCYKRTNTTRSAKPPKVTKAKQKEAKEVEEMERLAALMNAQFQEIDKVSLVVE